MTFAGRHLAVARRLGRTGLALLALSLAASALLTAVALRGPDHHWLAWVSLLPLFVAIRRLPWPLAATAGGLWGACLYLFFITGPAATLEASVLSLVLLIAVPALYTGVSARLVRAIGFSPIVLAAGWIAVEIGLRPVGLHQGLLAGALGESSHLHQLAHSLGYVVVAWMLACANASLLAIVSQVRWTIPVRATGAGLPNSGPRSHPQTCVFIQLLALRQAHPRAPPRWAAALA